MKKNQKLIVNSIKDLLPGIAQIIEQARSRAAIFLNAETTLMYWGIGNFINRNLKENNRTEYGSQILVTLSQELTKQFGKGFTYSALTRMCKVATVFEEKNIATLSQHFSWSHLIELSLIDDEVKRDYYMLMSAEGNWSIRRLKEEIDKMLFERTAIARKTQAEISTQLNAHKKQQINHPDLYFKNTYILDFLNLPQNHSESELEDALVGKMEQFILELGDGFAFIERQKRISIDGEDYYLDLLFYHRKLKRLIAIDLKLGKFKAAYKGQMELYLRWLEKYELMDGEEKPIGLLLCGEGNSEHIELLMINEPTIKVAQYLTELPEKKWLAEKFRRAVELAKQQEIQKNL
ncbi:MAG: PDDEXK nuclease domain-containing protein [Bacteroidia bacterium]|jgi:predicted nuclease of restriction endonuclease-like (RecB) superfamily|nr:PDDEXK nuclease domain-containing protein [Bacteroidia bacterium]